MVRSFIPRVARSLVSLVVRVRVLELIGLWPGLSVATAAAFPLFLSLSVSFANSK